jgi:type II secretory pathway component PulM
VEEGLLRQSRKLHRYSRVTKALLQKLQEKEEEVSILRKAGKNGSVSSDKRHGLLSSSSLSSSSLRQVEVEIMELSKQINIDNAALTAMEATAAASTADEKLSTTEAGD